MIHADIFSSCKSEALETVPTIFIELHIIFTEYSASILNSKPGLKILYIKSLRKYIYKWDAVQWDALKNMYFNSLLYQFTKCGEDR